MYWELLKQEIPLTFGTEILLETEIISTTSTVGMTLSTLTTSDSSIFTITDCGLTIFMFSSLFLIIGSLLDRKLNRDLNQDLNLDHYPILDNQENQKKE